jgi:hypothetical protein
MMALLDTHILLLVYNRIDGVITRPLHPLMYIAFIFSMLFL